MVRFNKLLLSAAIASTGAYAENTLEEVVVTGNLDTRTYVLAETLDIAPDSAALLKKAPGANVNQNGPLTGIAQYRGMYGARINTNIDGTQISAGGPNWMDPPLSYAPAAMLDSLSISRGIAPVSAGQETIGGAIEAKTWSGDFGHSKDFELQSRIRAGAQSVDSGNQLSLALVGANENHRVKIFGMTESGDNAQFPTESGDSNNAEIIPTEYQRQRIDLGYGFTTTTDNATHTLQLDIGRNETGNTGTPALGMDIQYIDSDLGRAHYHLKTPEISSNLRIYASDIEHGMTNYHLRTAPMMASMYRRNIATGENSGLAFDITTGGWSFGLDSHFETHNSNIDNINNPDFFVVNFNNAARDVIGAFAEYEFSWQQNFKTELGLRANHVAMNADEVDGTPARMQINMAAMDSAMDASMDSMMGMDSGMSSGMGSDMNTMMTMTPAGQQLRDDFNNADRKQSDTNVDWVAKTYYQLNSDNTLYAGLARKSRSASYQERYLWLPMEATAGLADARTYVGNIELAPEVAHEIELGWDLQNQTLSLSPRLYYRDVKDYIQGTATAEMSAASRFVTMMNDMNGMSNQAPLQFNNVDAKLYGFDMDMNWQLSQFTAGALSLSGNLNYVRGERTDVSDNLYRIAPLNGLLALNFNAEHFGVSLENVLYAKQDKVSSYNGEQTTAGYGLVNLNGYWAFNDSARVSLGIDNLLNRNYQDHLSGYNRVMGNADVARGSRLPGYGRNLFARLDFNF